MNGVVVSVQRTWKVEEITTPKNEPPSMFVVEELCGIARGSAMDANGIAQHLGRKLNSPSPIVKSKALKVIKVLAQKGGPNFQKSITKFATLIRELQRYSGAPDQFLGDVLNKRVRDSAGEAAEAIFNPHSQSNVSEDPSIKERIKGLGGSGNPEVVRSHGFSDTSTTIFQAASAVNSGSVKRSVYDKTPTPIGTGKKMEGFGNTSISYQSNNSQGSLPTPPRTQWQMEEVHHSRNVSSGSFTEVVKLPGSFSFRNDPDKAAQTLGSEQQIVDDICTPGGIRPAPSNEDLRKFVEKVSVLEGEKVGSHLEAKLANTNWQVKLRALHVLEAVVNLGGTESCFMVVQHFIGNPEAIKKCQQSQQMSVKEKATELLAIIGAQHPTQNGNVTSGQNDLLADIDGVQGTSDVQTGNLEDPFDILSTQAPNQSVVQPMQSAQLQVGSQPQVAPYSVNVAQDPITKTISAELGTLSILDMSIQQSALDEALFSDEILQPQQVQPSNMMPQQMYQQQQMQNQMYGAQEQALGYGQQMGGMSSWQQQAMMMQGTPQQAGNFWQPTLQQPMQQMPMASMNTLQTQHQTPVASVPLNSFAGKGHMAPTDRKQKKESAFDFVQDHMAGLKK